MVPPKDEAFELLLFRLTSFEPLLGSLSPYRLKHGNYGSTCREHRAWCNSYSSVSEPLTADGVDATVA
jgi:hypothetical protein